MHAILKIMNTHYIFITFFYVLLFLGLSLYNANSLQKSALNYTKI